MVRGVLRRLPPPGGRGRYSGEREAKRGNLGLGASVVARSTAAPALLHSSNGDAPQPYCVWSG